MRQGKGLIWASVTHFIVDFICAWMIFSKIPGNGPWYLELLLYNFLAFAGQLPLGLLIDHLREKHKSISRCAASAGCAICLAVLVTGIDSWFLAAAAGIGNGLFHAGSGAQYPLRNTGIVHQQPEHSYRQALWVFSSVLCSRFKE